LYELPNRVALPPLVPVHSAVPVALVNVTSRRAS
jgi:hypothetical protein